MHKLQADAACVQPPNAFGTTGQALVVACKVFARLQVKDDPAGDLHHLLLAVYAADDHALPVQLMCTIKHALTRKRADDANGEVPMMTNPRHKKNRCSAATLQKMHQAAALWLLADSEQCIASILSACE